MGPAPLPARRSPSLASTPRGEVLRLNLLSEHPHCRGNRALSVPYFSPFAAVLTRIAEVTSLEPAGLRILWQDDDGDRFELLGEEDWRNALETDRAVGRPRAFVLVLQEVSTEVPAAAAASPPSSPSSSSFTPSSSMPCLANQGRARAVSHAVPLSPGSEVRTPRGIPSSRSSCFAEARAASRRTASDNHHPLLVAHLQRFTSTAKEFPWDSAASPTSPSSRGAQFPRSQTTDHLPRSNASHGGSKRRGPTLKALDVHPGGLPRRDESELGSCTSSVGDPETPASRRHASPRSIPASPPSEFLDFPTERRVPSATSKSSPVFASLLGEVCTPTAVGEACDLKIPDGGGWGGFAPSLGCVEGLASLCRRSSASNSAAVPAAPIPSGSPFPHSQSAPTPQLGPSGMSRSALLKGIAQCDRRLEALLRQSTPEIVATTVTACGSPIVAPIPVPAPQCATQTRRPAPATARGPAPSTGWQGIPASRSAEIKAKVRWVPAPPDASCRRRYQCLRAEPQPDLPQVILPQAISRNNTHPGPTLAPTPRPDTLRLSAEEKRITASVGPLLTPRTITSLMASRAFVCCCVLLFTAIIRAN